jgi:hypothetical protein
MCAVFVICNLKWYGCNEIVKYLKIRFQKWKTVSSNEMKIWRRVKSDVVVDLEIWSKWPPVSTIYQLSMLAYYKSGSIAIKLWFVADVKKLIAWALGRNSAIITTVSELDSTCNVCHFTLRCLEPHCIYFAKLIIINLLISYWFIDWLLSNVHRTVFQLFSGRGHVQ